MAYWAPVSFHALSCRLPDRLSTRIRFSVLALVGDSVRQTPGRPMALKDGEFCESLPSPFVFQSL